MMYIHAIFVLNILDLGIFKKYFSGEIKNKFTENMALRNAYIPILLYSIMKIALWLLIDLPMSPWVVK